MANAFLMFTLKLGHLLPFTEEHSLFKMEDQGQVILGH